MAQGDLPQVIPDADGQAGAWHAPVVPLLPGMRLRGPATRRGGRCAAGPHGAWLGSTLAGTGSVSPRGEGEAGAKGQGSVTHRPHSSELTPQWSGVPRGQRVPQGTAGAGHLLGLSPENGIILQPAVGRYQCHCSACKGPVIFKKTHFEADWSLSEQISCSFS